MILVTVGSCEYPFDRLLQAVAELPADQPVVVQHGTSELRPPRAECFDFVPFEALVDYVRRASVVVTHAGIGSVLTSLANGKRPVVVPRRRRFGEAVDDHQVDSARRLAEIGLVSCVEDPQSLGRVLAEGAPTGNGPMLGDGESRLARELHEYLHASARAPAVPEAPASSF
jgi:UDP-N-acetylglucosamine transferase subunit ALG13